MIEIKAGGEKTTDLCPTQRAIRSGIKMIENNSNFGYRIRKLTPKECWRLMGFSDDAFEKAKNAGVSDTQLYKQAGNSIVTHVLYYIYVELYKAMPYLFDDLKVGSYFSGIGAFETALDMLYENENANNFYIPKINFQDSQI
jgi:DNA (cytosine-5)-methyltransferase 1